MDDEFIGIYVKGGCRLHLNGIVACREQRAHEHSACAVGTWLRVWAVQDEFTALPRLPLCGGGVWGSMLQTAHPIQRRAA